MDIEERIRLIKEVGQEVITDEDLREVLKKDEVIAYDGFEPSGKIHIAQGLLRVININKLTSAGITFKMLVADWFALMNNKMEGDLEKIQTLGKYFIEVWKSCGLDTTKVQFLWSSDMIEDNEYWLKVIKIARLNSVTRITRCAEIMGRSEKESLTAAQIFYPCMQVADIFHLKVDICQLGMDQRKVNVLAREIAPKLRYKKPIIVSHHMLMGLGQPPVSDLKGAERGVQLKMSKSNPDSAIFMTDDVKEVERKLKKAYCPEGEVNENPILEYCKYIIFEKVDSMRIARPEKFGGNLEFHSYEELEKTFAAKELHPADLKNATAIYINKLLQPVRDHFEKDADAKKLLEEVKKII